MSEFNASPQCIAAGIASLQRDELAQMIALLEVVGAWAQAGELIRFATEKVHPGQKFLEALDGKISASREKLVSSSCPDEDLRYRLWAGLQAALQIRASLPLSVLSLQRDTTEVAFHASKNLASQYKKKLEESERDTGATGLGEGTVRRIWDRLWVRSRSEAPDFGDIVGFEATKILGELLQEKDGLSKEEREKLWKELAEVEVDDEDLRKAIQQGDVGAIGALLAGGSVAGLALAVKISGFAGYIMAAKLSAVIPLVGGQTLVSSLSVVTSGVFVGPVVAGLTWVAWKRGDSAIKKQIANRLLVVLALKGSVPGADSLLDSFRKLDKSAPGTYMRQADAKRLREKLRDVNEASGGQLSAMPGNPPAPWNVPFDRSSGQKEGSSHSSRNDSLGIALSSGFLTYGELLYMMWSIDQRVLDAAQFSRAAEIEDVLDFHEVIAESWQGMREASARGLQSGLQGYVGEQIVKGQLEEAGHTVSLPSSSNEKGYDLVVDGQKYQVKTTQSPDDLAEHFDKYPDIRVYATKEMQERVKGEEWADKVEFVEGFDLEAAKRLTQDALDWAAKLDELPLPANTAIGTAIVKAWRAWKGQISLADLPEEVAIESIHRGLLSWAGNIAGGWGGLVLFGKAGMVVVGPAVGVAAIFAAPWVREFAKERLDPQRHQNILRLASYHQKLAIVHLKAQADELMGEAGASEMEAWMRKERAIYLLELVQAIRVVKVECPKDAQALIVRCAEAQIDSSEFASSQKELLEALRSRASIVPATLKDKAAEGASWLKGRLGKGDESD